ncbi:hypothetical protein PR001_g29448 [Phytophthora rubi]|uniref:Uncharacterized protein n=1 Tax=Phytophthora rubi TaxID=129364 RepID=A0A6A3H136_9STRA|nr:hypothetical protein PR001_g29448 [Phytophthora rubi]
MRGEKGEPPLRRSLRIVGLPAEVVPRVAEKFEPSRPTSEVSALSAEVEVSQSSEAEPSAAPEAPVMPENVVPSPSSSEMKTSEVGQSDGAGAQPSARVDGGWNQGVRAERESVVPQAESKALTGASQPQSANPEPTAVDPCSSQVEGGALSSLGCRWTQLRIQGSASTGTNPARLSCTPESAYFSLNCDGVGSTSFRPEQIPIQWSRAVPEVAGADGLDHVQLPEMSEAEMITFGRSQAERWMSSPPGVVNPIDVAYAPCHSCHGLWEFIRAASATARHLMGVTRSPSARWLNVFKAERRRIPLVSNLKAARVSLRLMPPIACVSILQTMLHETGYEFLNQVPEWHTLSELSSVPEAQIRLEIERIENFIETELVAWNTAVELTTSYVRPLSDSLLLASAQTAESQVGFPLNKGDDDIVDEVTQLLLGAEVVLRLWLTGLGARGSVSRIQDESSGKRQLLSAGCVIPKGRDSSESVSETRCDFAKIPGHSMANVGPSSDTSLMVTDNGVNLCELSSSGSSLMSVPDITVGVMGLLSPIL